MKKLLLFISLSSFLFAQGGFKISTGPNFSSFPHEKNTEIFAGYNLGIQYEYYLQKSFSISLGIIYSKEGGILKNKIVRPSVLSEGSSTADVFYEDIHAIIGYIQLPIRLGYSFYLLKDQKTAVFFGGTLLIPIKDYSFSDNYRFAFLYSKGETDYNFEYYSTGAESFFFENDSNYSIDFGFEQYYKDYFLDMSLSYHLSDFSYVDYISEIREKLLSVKIAIGYKF